MKTVSTIFGLVIITSMGFGQIHSNYHKGFDVGFTEGYCYNSQTVDCFYPMVPEAPLPRINESKDSYQQGYNRGFQFGMDLKRSHDALQSANVNLNHQLAAFNNYIQQNPIDAMAAVGMMLQKKYDARKGWIQDRINQQAQLLMALFNTTTLPPTLDANSIRASRWQATVNYVNRISAVDYADDAQFRAIQANFEKLDQYYQNTYNEIIRAVRSGIADD